MAPAVAAGIPLVPPVPIDPLDDIRDVLTVCGLAANVDRFIACHGITITGMDDFEMIEHTETESVVKMHNERYRNAAQKIGFPGQKKLKGFIFWYHDRLRRQEPIVAAEFTDVRMKKAVKECAAEKSKRDADPVEIVVGKIETELEWWNWKDRFYSRLDNINGALDAPIAHICRPTMPAGWTIAQATSETERRIHSISHSRPEFDTDNDTVWAELI